MSESTIFIVHSSDSCLFRNALTFMLRGGQQSLLFSPQERKPAHLQTHTCMRIHFDSSRSNVFFCTCALAEKCPCTCYNNEDTTSIILKLLSHDSPLCRGKRPFHRGRPTEELKALLLNTAYLCWHGDSIGLQNIIKNDNEYNY